MKQQFLQEKSHSIIRRAFDQYSRKKRIHQHIKNQNFSGLKTLLTTIWENTTPNQSAHPESLSALWHYFTKKPAVLDHFIDFIKEHSKQTFPEQLLLMELLLIAKRHQQSIDIGNLLTRQHSRDLRLQDIRARAQLLLEFPDYINQNIKNGFNPYRNMFCKDPFHKLTTGETGSSTVCCTNWLNEPIGSFYENSFDEVWNSKAANNIRHSIIDGSFQYCNKTACPFIRNKSRDIARNGQNKLAKKMNIKSTLTQGIHPRRIVLSEDPSCNLTCPSCRDGMRKGDEEKLLRYEEKILPYLLDNPIDDIRICGHGDPFASQHYMRFMAKLDHKKHNIKRITLLTNGVLLSERVWNKLSNLHPFNIYLSVSIDAASKDTYHNVRRGGDWDRLLDNLKFMSALRQQGKIKKLNFNFVVQNDNYQEMPAFIKLAKSLKVDNVYFAPYYKTGDHISNAIYQEQAIYLPNHPNHGAFLQVLSDDAFNYPEVVMFPVSKAV